MFVWVGQAEFIYFFGEVSWGSGFIYIYRYPPVLNISNGENGSRFALSLQISLKIKNESKRCVVLLGQSSLS